MEILPKPWRKSFFSCKQLYSGSLECNEFSNVISALDFGTVLLKISISGLTGSFVVVVYFLRDESYSIIIISFIILTISFKILANLT